jgi:thiamine kinase-like enzyme
MRISAEYKALKLYEDHNIINVPRIYAADWENGMSILEWIEGHPVDQPSYIDIDAILAFIEAHKNISRVAEKRHYGTAFEACLSIAEIIRQINFRVGRLYQSIRNDLTGQLNFFLLEEFPYVFKNVIGWLNKKNGQEKIDFINKLPSIKQCLIPADIGFHNMLWNNERGLIFLDFEYFGLDDPVKLLADFILHPAHTDLPFFLKEQFIEGMNHIFKDDHSFKDRYILSYPLFALRWCTILLNEFNARSWYSRQRAGASENWKDIQKTQIGKARLILSHIEATVFN